MCVVRRAVAHDQVIVHQHLDTGAAQGVARDVISGGEILVAAGQVLWWQAVDGRGDLPLVFIILELARKIRGVLEGNEFAERIRVIEGPSFRRGRVRRQRG